MQRQKNKDTIYNLIYVALHSVDDIELNAVRDTHI